MDNDISHDVQAALDALSARIDVLEEKAGVKTEAEAETPAPEE